MGPLPDHSVRPSPIFQSVAVDLLGPTEYQGTVNKRQVGKGWGVMFICSATSAVHVEFYGHILNRQLSDGPTLVYVHERSTIKNPVRQRRTASGSVKAPDSLRFQRGSRMGWEEWHEWHLVPTGRQHFNRHAERMIGILKKQIWRSFEGTKYTH
jgi:hypothetical protein